MKRDTVLRCLKSRDTTSIINVDDIPTEEIPQGNVIFFKVLCQDDNFRYPR